ncbi:MAG TPA: hypothetical protein VKA08_19180 [Balneolales bacterium]|nr:hypothetical protein [Balneolales bacterium]
MNKQSHNVIWLTLLFAMTMIFYSCDKTPGVVNQTQSDSNLLLNGEITPTNFVFASQGGDTTVSVHLQVQVNDTSAIKGYPRYQINDNSTDSTISGGVLSQFDAANHLFSGSATIKTSTRDFRNLTLLLYAVNKENLLTNTYRAVITVKGVQGHPPQILSVSNPDTVKIPASGTQPIVFTAKVTDPDGQSNISQVLVDLISTSTGVRLNGSPFQMYDDGNQNNVGGGSGSGDLVAGDSVYTRTFQINSSNTPSKIAVKYYAIDKSGLSSDTLSRSLDIVK